MPDSDRDITYGPDGPQGHETIRFSELGVRLAVLQPNGKVVHGDTYSPQMLGGAVPVPGDRISTLWWRDDPDNVDSFEVISRHYIGEFDGDNCWWLLVRPITPDKVDKALFRLARADGARTRKFRQHQAKNIRKSLAMRLSR